jgi:N utilization substance protein A
LRPRKSSKNQISLPEARDIEADAELGQMLLIESTPRDFGRIAAQTAKQVILQRIREAERDALYNTFADSAGEIAHGTIQSVDYHSGDVVVNLEGAEAILPSREQVPGEKYRRGQRLRAYVVEVRRGSRGPQITLSRRSPALLRRLLELEVPEIFSGAVEIKAIAREAGSRSKVAVHATQEGVDPVGSCVGVRGGRIQNVVNELGGEKIDVVQWSPEVATFIANALSPAKVMNVLLSNGQEGDKTATVIVPDRQLSLAIGKEGQNARLAAKLTGWRIDIKSATEAAEETLGRLEDAEIPFEDMDLLSLAEALLRKQEGDGGFSDDDRRLIDEVVTEAMVGPWPEQEPVVEAPEEEAEPEPVAAAVPEGEPLQEEEVEGEEAKEGEGAGPEELPAADVDRRTMFEMEGEQELPFEGEPIEDSIGWVATEPEEDYYTGWAEEEEEPTEVEYEWVIDEVPEKPEEFRPERKKKGKKKRRQQRYDYEEESDTTSWRGGGRQRSR